MSSSRLGQHEADLDRDMDKGVDYTASAQPDQAAQDQQPYPDSQVYEGNGGAGSVFLLEDDNTYLNEEQSSSRPPPRDPRLLFGPIGISTQPLGTVLPPMAAAAGVIKPLPQVALANYKNFTGAISDGLSASATAAHAALQDEVAIGGKGFTRTSKNHSRPSPASKRSLQERSPSLASGKREASPPGSPPAIDLPTSDNLLTRVVESTVNNRSDALRRLKSKATELALRPFRERELQYQGQNTAAQLGIRHFSQEISASIQDAIAPSSLMQILQRSSEVIRHERAIADANRRPGPQLSLVTRLSADPGQKQQQQQQSATTASRPTRRSLLGGLEETIDARSKERGNRRQADVHDLLYGIDGQWHSMTSQLARVNNDGAVLMPRLYAVESSPTRDGNQQTFQNARSTVSTKGSVGGGSSAHSSTPAAAALGDASSSENHSTQSKITEFVNARFETAEHAIRHSAGSRKELEALRSAFEVRALLIQCETEQQIKVLKQQYERECAAYEREKAKFVEEMKIYEDQLYQYRQYYMPLIQQHQQMLQQQGITGSHIPPGIPPPPKAPTAPKAPQPLHLNRVAIGTRAAARVSEILLSGEDLPAYLPEAWIRNASVKEQISLLRSIYKRHMKEYENELAQRIIRAQRMKEYAQKMESMAKKIEEISREPPMPPPRVVRKTSQPAKPIWRAFTSTSVLKSSEPKTAREEASTPVFTPKPKLPPEAAGKVKLSAYARTKTLLAALKQRQAESVPQEQSEPDEERRENKHLVLNLQQPGQAESSAPSSPSQPHREATWFAEKDQVSIQQAFALFRTNLGPSQQQKQQQHQHSRRHSSSTPSHVKKQNLVSNKRSVLARLRVLQQHQPARPPSGSMPVNAAAEENAPQPEVKEANLKEGNVKQEAEPAKQPSQAATTDTEVKEADKARLAHLARPTGNIKVSRRKAVRKSQTPSQSSLEQSSVRSDSSLTSDMEKKPYADVSKSNTLTPQRTMKGSTGKAPTASASSSPRTAATPLEPRSTATPTTSARPPTTSPAPSPATTASSISASSERGSTTPTFQTEAARKMAEKLESMRKAANEAVAAIEREYSSNDEASPMSMKDTENDRGEEASSGTSAEESEELAQYIGESLDAFFERIRKQHKTKRKSQIRSRSSLRASSQQQLRAGSTGVASHSDETSVRTLGKPAQQEFVHPESSASEDEDNLGMTRLSTESIAAMAEVNPAESSIESADSSVSSTSTAEEGNESMRNKKASGKTKARKPPRYLLPKSPPATSGGALTSETPQGDTPPLQPSSMIRLQKHRQLLQRLRSKEKTRARRERNMVFSHNELDRLLYQDESGPARRRADVRHNRLAATVGEFVKQVLEKAEVEFATLHAWKDHALKKLNVHRRVQSVEQSQPLRILALPGRKTPENLVLNQAIESTARIARAQEEIARPIARGFEESGVSLPSDAKLIATAQQTLPMPVEIYAAQMPLPANLATRDDVTTSKQARISIHALVGKACPEDDELQAELQARQVAEEDRLQRLQDNADAQEAAIAAAEAAASMGFDIPQLRLDFPSPTLSPVLQSYTSPQLHPISPGASPLMRQKSGTNAFDATVSPIIQPAGVSRQISSLSLPAARVPALQRAASLTPLQSWRTGAGESSTPRDPSTPSGSYKENIINSPQGSVSKSGLAASVMPDVVVEATQATTTSNMPTDQSATESEVIESSLPLPHHERMVFANSVGKLPHILDATLISNLLFDPRRWARWELADGLALANERTIQTPSTGAGRIPGHGFGLGLSAIRRFALIHARALKALNAEPDKETEPAPEGSDLSASEAAESTHSRQAQASSSVSTTDDLQGLVSPEDRSVLISALTGIRPSKTKTLELIPDMSNAHHVRIQSARPKPGKAPIKRPLRKAKLGRSLVRSPPQTLLDKVERVLDGISNTRFGRKYGSRPLLGYFDEKLLRLARGKSPQSIEQLLESSVPPIGSALEDDPRLHVLPTEDIAARLMLAPREDIIVAQANASKINDGPIVPVSKSINQVNDKALDAMKQLLLDPNSGVLFAASDKDMNILVPKPTSGATSFDQLAPSRGAAAFGRLVAEKLKLIEGPQAELARLTEVAVVTDSTTRRDVGYESIHFTEDVVPAVPTKLQVVDPQLSISVSGNVPPLSPDALAALFPPQPEPDANLSQPEGPVHTPKLAASEASRPRSALGTPVVNARMTPAPSPAPSVGYAPSSALSRASSVNSHYHLMHAAAAHAAAAASDDRTALGLMRRVAPPVVTFDVKSMVAEMQQEPSQVGTQANSNVATPKSGGNPGNNEASSTGRKSPLPQLTEMFGLPSDLYPETITPDEFYGGPQVAQTHEPTRRRLSFAMPEAPPSLEDLAAITVPLKRMPTDPTNTAVRGPHPPVSTARKLDVQATLLNFATAPDGLDFEPPTPPTKHSKSFDFKAHAASPVHALSKLQPHVDTNANTTEITQPTEDAEVHSADISSIGSMISGKQPARKTSWGQNNKMFRTGGAQADLEDDFTLSNRAAYKYTYEAIVQAEAAANDEDDDDSRTARSVKRSSITAVDQAVASPLTRAATVTSLATQAHPSPATSRSMLSSVDAAAEVAVAAGAAALLMSRQPSTALSRCNTPLIVPQSSLQIQMQVSSRSKKENSATSHPSHLQSEQSARPTEMRSPISSSGTITASHSRDVLTLPTAQNHDQSKLATMTPVRKSFTQRGSTPDPDRNINISVNPSETETVGEDESDDEHMQNENQHQILDSTVLIEVRDLSDVKAQTTRMNSADRKRRHHRSTNRHKSISISSLYGTPNESRRREFRKSSTHSTRSIASLQTTNTELSEPSPQMNTAESVDLGSERQASLDSASHHHRNLPPAATSGRAHEPNKEAIPTIDQTLSLSRVAIESRAAVLNAMAAEVAPLLHDTQMALVPLVQRAEQSSRRHDPKAAVTVMKLPHVGPKPAISVCVPLSQSISSQKGEVVDPDASAVEQRVDDQSASKIEHVEILPHPTPPVTSLYKRLHEIAKPDQPASQTVDLLGEVTEPLPASSYDGDPEASSRRKSTVVSEFVVNETAHREHHAMLHSRHTSLDLAHDRRFVAPLASRHIPLDSVDGESIAGTEHNQSVRNLADQGLGRHPDGTSEIPDKTELSYDPDDEKHHLIDFLSESQAPSRRNSASQFAETITTLDHQKGRRDDEKVRLRPLPKPNHQLIRASTLVARSVAATPIIPDDDMSVSASLPSSASPSRMQTPVLIMTKPNAANIPLRAEEAPAIPKDLHRMHGLVTVSAKPQPVEDCTISTSTGNQTTNLPSLPLPGHDITHLNSLPPPRAATAIANAGPTEPAHPARAASAKPPRPPVLGKQGGPTQPDVTPLMMRNRIFSHNPVLSNPLSSTPMPPFNIRSGAPTPMSPQRVKLRDSRLAHFAASRVIRKLKAADKIAQEDTSKYLLLGDPENATQQDHGSATQHGRSAPAGGSEPEQLKSPKSPSSNSESGPGSPAPSSRSSRQSVMTSRLNIQLATLVAQGDVIGADLLQKNLAEPLSQAQVHDLLSSSAAYTVHKTAANFMTKHGVEVIRLPFKPTVPFNEAGGVSKGERKPVNVLRYLSRRETPAVAPGESEWLVLGSGSRDSFEPTDTNIASGTNAPQKVTHRAVIPIATLREKLDTEVNQLYPSLASEVDAPTKPVTVETEVKLESLTCERSSPELRDSMTVTLDLSAVRAVNEGRLRTSTLLLSRRHETPSTDQTADSSPPTIDSNEVSQQQQQKRRGSSLSSKQELRATSPAILPSIHRQFSKHTSAEEALSRTVSLQRLDLSKAEKQLALSLLEGGVQRAATERLGVRNQGPSSKFQTDQVAAPIRAQGVSWISSIRSPALSSAQSARAEAGLAYTQPGVIPKQKTSRWRDAQM